jgi:hypothetical protein
MSIGKNGNMRARTVIKTIIAAARSVYAPVMEAREWSDPPLALVET